MYKENKPIDVSPYDHPDIYPGPRPDSSFIYYKGKAHRIVEKQGEPIEDLPVEVSDSDSLSGSFQEPSQSIQSIREFLQKNHLLPLEKRVPLVAYGSNICLAQLRYKFSLNKNLNDFVLCMRSSMVDSDIVYGSFLAPYGALPAIVAPVKDAVTEIWLTFVDPEQLEHMNRTEGGYVLREHKGEKLVTTNGEQFESIYAYYYPHALQFDEQWFRFKDIRGESRLPSEWQADMLNLLIERYKFEGTREEFIHLLRWNRAFFGEVSEWLTQFDSRFDHPDWQGPESIQRVGELKRSLVKGHDLDRLLAIYQK